MKRYSYLLIFSLLILSITACDKYLDAAYRNPNNPSTVPPDQVLAPMIAKMANGLQFDGRYTGRFVQNWASTASFDSWDRHGYIPASDAGGEVWRMHYYDIGQNNMEMIANSRGAGQYDLTAIGYSIFAWSWMCLTDTHGDVILEESFDRNKLVFKYDPQEKVYEYVNKLLDSANYYYALAATRQPTASLAAVDAFFYGGNIARWQKFAHGVRARNYQRYSNKASMYKPDSVMKYADLAMSSTADDALVKYVTGSTLNNENNFMGARRGNLGAWRQTQWTINILNGVLPVFSGVVDPRMKFMFRAAGDGGFRGVVPVSGMTATVAQQPLNFWGFASTSSPTGGIDTAAKFLFKNASPFPIMTYAEMQFLKAEAAFKKGDKATAQAAYKNGLGGAFDFLTTWYGSTISRSNENFTAAERAAYINNPLVSPLNATDLTMNRIMLQKYIHMWGWGFLETWVDMRRNNYDTAVYNQFTPPSGTNLYPDNLNKLCNRIRPRYNSEYIWNVVALDGIGARTADYHTKPCWFQLP
jgi:hypothetical protein